MAQITLRGMELNSLRWTNTSRQLMDWSIQFSDPRSWGTGLLKVY